MRVCSEGTRQAPASDRRWIDQQVAGFQQDADREKCFERLYRRFHRPLQSFFAKRAGSVEECLDLTQETFLRVYKGLESFRGDCSFESWLFRIAHNTYLSSLRRKGSSMRAREIAVDELVPSHGDLAGVSDLAEPLEVLDPLDRAMRSEERRLLRRAVEKLPEKMRRCLVLRIDQGLSYREIGVAMGISADTVGAHLYQATRLLKRRLVLEDLLPTPDVMSPAPGLFGAARATAGRTPLTSN